MTVDNVSVEKIKKIEFYRNIPVRLSGLRKKERKKEEGWRLDLG